MKHFTLSLLCIIILGSFGIALCQEDEEVFPKIGYTKNNGSNVRAGNNINFESLCKLDKADPLKIVSKTFSWYKIELPQKARIYIKSDYVDVDPDRKGIGTVNASRVNLRAGPDTARSIIGQVSKEKELVIVSEQEGWYEIVPPEGSMAWIHSSQVTFDLDDITFTE